MTADMWIMVLIVFAMTSVSTAIGRKLSQKYNEKKRAEKRKAGEFKKTAHKKKNKTEILQANKEEKDEIKWKNRF